MSEHVPASTLREWTKLLRDGLGLVAPVRVRRKRLKDAWGTCSAVLGDDGRIAYFQIQLDSRLCEGGLFLALVHEMAHASAWHSHPTLEHDVSFGIAYARAFQIISEENDDDGS